MLTPFCLTFTSADCVAVRPRKPTPFDGKPPPSVSEMVAPGTRPNTCLVMF